MRDGEQQRASSGHLRYDSERDVTFVDTKSIPAVSRKPGWYGRQFDSPSMSFVHYEFDAGATVHRHAHDQEEVWHILEGELDVSIGGDTRRAGPGMVAIVPANTEHEVKALTAGKAIVVDFPLRPV
jgi:quercetin dioxygenase-like cupin family protein